MPTLNKTKDVFSEIMRFNDERNLTKYDVLAEFRMLHEELIELITAKDDIEEIDALCDVIVFAVGALHKKGIDPIIAMEETLKEIHSRKGSINEETGKWEKDKSQPKHELYTANYYRAKI